jgi:hypothetical protein
MPGQHVPAQPRTAAGTKAFLDRFDRQVDPEGVLPAEARACGQL